MLKPIGLTRINNILFFIILLCIVLYFGKEVLMLVTFAALLAMLMTPLSNNLENHHVSRVLSSLISVLIIIVVISGVFALLSTQIANVVKEIPRIKSEMKELISGTQLWITKQFEISFEQQVDTVKDHASQALGGAGNVIADIVKGTFTLLGRILLVVVFTFLFLLHREKYENFVVMLYKQEKRKDARDMIDKVSKISEQYLTGRLIAVVIIAILYVAGFWIIGLKNAALLSVIAAMIAIIPYIGTIIGGLIPFMMAIVDGSFHQALGVIIITLVVNMIAHYFIEPSVVGGSVNISPLFTILSLIVGGVLWGVAGIILFLPIIGILKIAIENVEGLEPYDYLIGDQEDTSTAAKILSRIKGFFSKKK